MIGGNTAVDMPSDLFGFWSAAERYVKSRQTGYKKNLDKPVLSC